MRIERALPILALLLGLGATGVKAQQPVPAPAQQRSVLVRQRKTAARISSQQPNTWFEIPFA